MPDRPDTREFLARWPARWTMTHASGNPWLSGSLHPDEVTLATVRSSRVAVIGTCPVTATELAELIAVLRTVAELDRLARRLPGCFHLLASIDGVVAARGSLAGTRRVFHTQIASMTVAGDRADSLARLAGAGIDEQALAARVACGGRIPPPLGEHSLWRQVRALAPDQVLCIDRAGTPSQSRWWRAPAPVVSMAQGARAVRQALCTAVSARIPAPAGRVGADLSGGLDSTSLCFLATHAGVKDFLTLRLGEIDPATEDAVFADKATSALPGVEHVVVAHAELPAWYGGVGECGDTEAPYALPQTLARMGHVARLLGARGVRRHLCGYGGDELFCGNPGYLPALLRRRPLRAINHARAYRSARRWSWPATISGLAGRESLPAWWHHQADFLHTGQLTDGPTGLGWGEGEALRAPRWVTPEAIDAARAMVRRAGDHAEPLADDRAQHNTLVTLRINAPAYRQLGRVFAGAGVGLELPLLDDQVIEAVLAIRQHERCTPMRYKPLLVQAMGDILPEANAARTSKGDADDEAREGLRHHLPAILDFFADSALAAHGLIDPDLLRQQMRRPRRDNNLVFALDDLLGCETWLRAAENPPTHRRSTSATPATP
jgi:asparagine synthase (glutamine-hydrolysing)